jgi:uncharacterized protein (TIGR02147 family)
VRVGVREKQDVLYYTLCTPATLLFSYFNDMITKDTQEKDYYMENKLPNIFEYNDFRKFLIDYQTARQKQDKEFTKSELTRRMNLPNTRSYFTDVLKGKRVTPTFIERFIDVFALDQHEAQYFRALIKFNQEENPHERELYFEQLISLNRTPKRVLNQNALVYYSKWYNSAIRALLNIYDFSDDYTALAKKLFPPISVKEAKEAIGLLIELELISKNEHGFYKPTEKSIKSEDFLKDAIAEHFQMKCIDLAKQSFTHSSQFPKNMTVNTISISENGYKRIEKNIEKFRSEIRAIVHKDENPADRVYQLNLLLYPISQ